MGWTQASNNDVMSRLLAKGGPTKDAGSQAAYASAPQAYAPGAPAQPVASITGSQPAPKLADAALPTWGGEQGYAGLNALQSQFVASQSPSTGQAQPQYEQFNWSQQRPSASSGLPAWADRLLNQSAYNALPKNTSAPTYAPEYASGTIAGRGPTRYDTTINFPTTGGMADQMGRHYNIPRHVRAQDWYGEVDTSRPGWTGRNAARYSYRPDAPGGFGEFLMAAAPLFGGAMLAPMFGLGMGDLGTALSNASSVAVRR